MEKLTTRFAPSPTGMLHIGGVRTALFDYLAAKSTGGRFILRIEDTDRERFVEGAIEQIHAGLSWLGIEHDGEVVAQSERLPIYQEHAHKLVAEQKAYKCFCTSERLKELKEKQEKEGKPPVYDRECLSLTEEEIAKKEQAGEKYVIRFKIPETPAKVSWKDRIKGKVEFTTNILEDFIILKSDSWPTYNFANVVDDHDMKIGLVIRGDEFVPSTPKHILLYLALGWEPVNFAHVPVIVGADNKKLSKRNGDTSVEEYRKKGYLPEALINFLAFLGWNPGTTEEIFSLQELEKKFSIDRVGKAPAVFDIERLNYLNGVYIRNLSTTDLSTKLQEFDNKYSKTNKDLFLKSLEVEKSRLKTLADFREIFDSYLEMLVYDPAQLVFKKSNPVDTKRALEMAAKRLEETEWSEKNPEDFNQILADIVSELKLGNGDVFWPIRVALSGLERSASPSELLWALGKDESVARIAAAREKL
jgi:glutamyl-tRNA synthetase